MSEEQQEQLKRLVDLLFTEIWYTNNRCPIEFAEDDTKIEECKFQTTDLVDNIQRRVQDEAEKGNIVLVDAEEVAGVIEQQIWKRIEQDEEITEDTLTEIIDEHETRIFEE